MAHVRKGDTVLVLSGADKGKSGRVLRVIPDKDKVVVEGVNIIKRHTRPTQRNPKGGIVEKEAPIHISNVKRKTT
jgi:large subunit ribosomal protein L24